MDDDDTGPYNGVHHEPLYVMQVTMDRVEWIRHGALLTAGVTWKKQKTKSEIIRLLGLQTVEYIINLFM